MAVLGTTETGTTHEAGTRQTGEDDRPVPVITLPPEVIKAGPTVPDQQPGAGAQDSSQLSPNQASQLEQAVQRANAARMRQGNPYGVQRIPFLLTCRLWAEFNLSTHPSSTGAQFISLPVNPSNVKWRVGYRMVEGKNRGGRVLYTWKNRDRKTFMDEPLLQFTFRAGNIMSGVINETGEIIANPARQGVWELLRLLDEEKVIPARVNGQPVEPTSAVGQPNFVQITYSSMKFPRIDLFGFFKEDGIEFDDSADNPLDWVITCSFVVYDSVPRLNNAQAMRDSLATAPPPANSGIEGINTDPW